LIDGKIREFRNVGSGHERFFAASGNDDHTHRDVFVERVESLVQFVNGRLVERVEFFRTVDRYRGNAVFFGNQDVFVFHVVWFKLNSGSETVNVVPFPNSVSKVIVPLYFSMMCFVSPRPTPMPLVVVVNFGSKMRERNCGSMAVPWSLTQILT